MLFCAPDERIWVFTDESKNITSFNLEKTTYLPNLSTTYDSKKNYGNPSDGTYSPANIIGNMGCIYCGCEIEFTITTTGRFVSQSDPTKYRDFRIGIMPRITDQDGDQTYLWDLSTDPHSLRNSTSRVPHTDYSLGGEEVQLTIKAPSFSKADPYIDKYVLGDRESKCTRWWCDILMILDDLEAEDYRHLAEVDDYITRLNISWTCQNEDHPNHRGSFTFVLRGYYGVPEGGKQAKVIVTPNPKALNLDILDVIGSQEHIAHMLVLTNTSSTNWADRIFMFLSSDPDAWNNTRGDFKLRQVTDASKAIPFSVVVKYSEQEQTEYSGSDSYSVAREAGRCLDLHTKSGTLNRDGKPVYIIDYSADVFIKIPSSDPNNPAIALLAAEDSDTIANYAGIYSANIYYHVIYDDN
ncbi:MAG: hypothetical protein ILP16_05430 [Spirochaetales bacterium]|nr:hypothetical protein [Spirochaetales bacterium]